MKHLSFLLGATALMLTASCSNDELVDATQPQGIGFSTFVDNSTRAYPYGQDVTTSSLKDFAVWAVTWNPTSSATRIVPSSLFIGHKVYHDGTKWTYDPQKFWAAGDSYRFSAIAPYIGDANVLSVEQSLSDITDFEAIKGGLGITFDNSIAAENPSGVTTKKGADIDLCYAFKKIESAAANQDPVSLQFEHMLSRVKFTFRNTFPSIMSAIQITNLRITDATAKASINKVSEETLWTPVGTTTFGIDFTMKPRTGIVTEEKDYILGLFSSGATETTEGKAAGKQNEQESNHHYIFPLNEAKEYTVSFTVSLYNYDPTAQTFALVSSYHHSIKLPSINYVNNYSYNFVAEINSDNIDPTGKLNPIEFNPSVSEWTDFSNTDVTIPAGSDPSSGDRS